ncbi:NUDIX hydrolase [Guptibacillus hwajinpoensis]|uniref:NUDIX hydrolase n=1 Tax=Guptibacillus hwajinpoensis TaxID=208199 RepID=UPI00373636C9
MDYIKDIRGLVGSRPLILPGVAILLFDENNQQLLLQMRTDNKLWGLTGGFMEPGEAFEETAIRETYEELGVSIDNLSFKEILSGEKLYYQYPNGDEVYSVIAVYSANCENRDFNLDDEEVSKVQFFNLDELPKNINPNHKTVLQALGYLHHD